MALTNRSVRQATRTSPPARQQSVGVRLIERAISPGGKPVIGLLLFMAYGRLMRSMSRGSRFEIIRPGSIGIPALLQGHPGLSQTELADLLGIQRMTAGMQVAQCIDEGHVRRVRSVEDRRRYQLYVTPKGRAYLKRVAALVPKHEAELFGRLTQAEQAALQRLLGRLIDFER